MFAAVFLIFNYKIFTRYFEHDEAVWADEVLVILFVWIIFWANAFLVPDRMQITFDLVFRLLRRRQSGWSRWRVIFSSAAFSPGQRRDLSTTSPSCGASTRPCSICRSIMSTPALDCSCSP